MTVTDFGVAIVDGDTHLSKWVLEHGRLDIQDEYCRSFKGYIPVNGVVIDVGACIGDQTLSYAMLVGPNGMVLAYEPNPEAFECLRHNMRTLFQVGCYPYALGAELGHGRLLQAKNLGANQVWPGEGPVDIYPLDVFTKILPKLDFMKIDAEGFEPEILRGAVETLKRFKPVVLVEINRPLLEERGKTAADIIGPLESLGYDVRPSEPHHSFDMDQLDALCVPK